ncbi:hypothetical protein RRG08_009352 [Elysia crispata]|uniref:PiggyBac transposable element-derived protein domain-containing protein n=1 Tax=Elysia crispata TaxID=231223 RepID=A0AAE0XVJ2_9GAST|nr:hypothetical protein RRG08_009352 [Elysia crispata]
MGIFQCKVFSDYWRTFKRLYTTAFGQVMPRDRFMIIWRYLHLANNNAPQGENPAKLAKLRPMITHLNHVFQENSTPYRDVSIDVSMVKFKGRLAFRQYLPAKPINFQVYTRREAGQEQSLAHRVVKDLVAPLHHTGMHVYMDNFYTGVPLFR